MVHLADRVPSRGELILHPSGLTFEVRDALTGEVYTTYRDTSLLSFRAEG